MSWPWFLIGMGKPLFPRSESRISLQLAETRAFGNGVVLLRYQRPDTPGTGSVLAPGELHCKG